MRQITLVLALAVSSCSGSSTNFSSTPQRTAAAAPVVAALQAADFERVTTLSNEVLSQDRGNSQAAASRALATYIQTMSTLRKETMAVLESFDRKSGFDRPALRRAFDSAASSLKVVRADLDAAAKDAGFSLELCLACWERDWNHTGEIDRGDRLLFQLEIDKDGNRFEEGDPRRKPTFQFDVGDLHWARAMISFQHAAIEIMLAYRWSDLNQLVLGAVFGMERAPTEVRIKLDAPDRVKYARKLILSGLKAAQQTRLAYLAETDDDREWVPNPKQKNHPLPLPVSDELYKTWGGVLSDLSDLVAGKTQLSVAQMAQLGDHQWQRPPGGFVDIHQMLSDPKTIVIDVNAVIARADKPGNPTAADIESLLRELLGSYYAKSGKASPIVGRISRMKGELERNEDTLGRKLRYLLWLN